MPFPAFVNDLPELDVPFDPSVVRTRAIAGPDALLVFFHILKDTTLDPHAHGAQWGTVIRGEIHLTIDGDTRIYRPGETYDIPAGAVHGAYLPAGTQVMDVFAEADRYPLKRT